MRLQPRALRALLNRYRLERLSLLTVPTAVTPDGVVHLGSCRHAGDGRSRPLPVAGTITIADYAALAATQRSCWRCGEHDVVLTTIDPSGILVALDATERAWAHLGRLRAATATTASNLAKAERAYSVALEGLRRLGRLDTGVDDDIRDARWQALEEHDRRQHRANADTQSDAARLLHDELASQGQLSGVDDTLVMVAWVASAPRVKLDAAAAAWALVVSGSRVVAAVPMWGLGWLIRQVATLSTARRTAPVELAAHPGMDAAAIAAKLYDPASDGPLRTLAGAVDAARLVAAT